MAVFQRYRRCCVSVCLAALLILGCSRASAAELSTLHACEDAAWPPYTYLKGEQVQGASYRLLQAVSQRLGQSLQFHVMPWKRCLAQVFAYPKTDVEMFINGSANDERMRQFLRTVPVFAVRPGYAFHRDNSQRFEHIYSIKDFNDLHVCGVMGYNYEYARQQGLTSTINTRSTNVQQVINRVIEKKCDVMLTTFEVIQGGLEIGSLSASHDFIYRVAPALDATLVYYWISRTSPRAETLLQEINTAIVQLQKEGEADKIFKRYLPEGDGLE
ncbi:substrate-binding periplasmic protein [Bacterioplanes sanyensis]|nr:transporter substrate-binding domain-containing protein [Bacterioplanes sanyensis]